MKSSTLCLMGALAVGALVVNVWSKPFSSVLGLAVPDRSVQAEPVQFAVADLLGHALKRNGQRWPRPVFEHAVEAISQASTRHGYSPALILSLIQTESRFDLRAVSSSGAVGLTQILPATAASVAGWEGMSPPTREELFDPGLNIRLGFTFLAYLEARYGSRDVALTAYNGGPEVLRMAVGPDLPLASYRQSIHSGERSFVQWLKRPAPAETAP